MSERSIKKSIKKKSSSKRKTSTSSSKKGSASAKKKGAAKKTRPRTARTGRFDPERERLSHEKKEKNLALKTQSYNEDDWEDEEEEPGEKYMTLGDHLEELRIRLLWMIGVVFIAAIVAGIFSQEIHQAVIAPYREITNNRDLYLMNVYGPFESVVKLSLLTGFTVAFPFVLFILWGFVTPAVGRLIAFLGNLSVLFSALLFWGGMVFTWFYILPLSLRFMFVDMILPGTVPQITLERYYTFVFMLELAAGLVFQLPLVLILLGALGILTTEFHKRIWKHVIVGIFVFSALVTPPDPLSQVLFAGPLIVLYFTAVLIVWIIERWKFRRYKKEMKEFSV